MRTLKFIVDGQLIAKDPTCDFSDLIPGSNGYLKAAFSFSSEWNNCNKVVAFYSPLGMEYPPQRLSDDCCLIPEKALKKRSFMIQVIGRCGDYKIKSNKIMISQNGGRA